MKNPVESKPRRRRRAVPPAEGPVSKNPYETMRKMLLVSFGSPVHQFTHFGNPLGFTVFRRGCHRARAASEWAATLRQKFEHETDLQFLIATATHPLMIYTEAWYDNRSHCDPENTLKLAKDALFYLAPRGSGQDKYTAGAHAGPLLDVLNPRIEVLVWQLSLDDAPEVVATPVRDTEVIVSEARVKPAKIGNPFSVLVSEDVEDE